MQHVRDLTADYPRFEDGRVNYTDERVCFVLNCVVVSGDQVLLTKRSSEVIAYPELGPEALAALTVEDFPAIVVIDSEGNNFYEIGQKPYRQI